jgi:hypothetical protein
MMTTSLSLADIVLQLSTEQQVSADTEQLLFPTEALLAAKHQWPEFWPCISALMLRMQAEEELTDEEYQLLFYGVMLLVDLADVTKAEAFFQWVDTSDELGSDLEYTLGDAMTEDLATMLYVLAAGQQAPLYQLLLSDKAGIYVKAAALTALFAQLELAEQQQQQIDQDCLSRVLQQAITIAAKRQQKFVLAEIAIWCITFGLEQFKAQFQVLLRQNKVDTATIRSREINRWQLVGSEKPLAAALVKPHFDVMSLQQWVAFQPPAELDAHESLTLLDEQAAIEIIRTKVLAGRNDACPCGSGKKYKKCCLN